MRILQLQTDSGLTGGVSNYIESIVKADCAKDVEFVVVVPNLLGSRDKAISIYGSSKLVVIPATYNFINFFSYLYKLLKIVKEYRVDIIHAHAIRSGLPASLVSLITNVPLIYTNHGLRFTQKKNFIIRFFFFLMEYITSSLSRVVISIRQFDQKTLLKIGLLKPEKFQTFTTQVSSLAPFAPRKSTGIKLSVIGVGSLIDVKRPDRFISWIKALQEIGIIVDASWVGDGPLRKKMESLAEDSGVKIDWCGQLSKIKVIDRLNCSQLLLLTSQFEVFPLSVLEAFSTGLPVISSDFNGVDEIILNGVNGIIVDADDSTSVAIEISKLLRDSNLLASYSISARNIYERQFSNPDYMAFQYISKFQQIYNANLKA